MSGVATRGPDNGYPLRREDVPDRVIELLRAFEREGTEGCWELPHPSGGDRVARIRVQTPNGPAKAAGLARLVAAYTCGEVPEGKLVMHHCDNPQCFNPAHLAIGTNAENVADMFRKGRAGASRPRAVVAPDGRRWPSIKAAAADAGVAVPTMWARCRNGTFGWSFDDKGDPRTSYRRTRVTPERRALADLLAAAEAAGGRIIVLLDPAPADQREAA
jgi:hypothetical protein